MYSFENDSAKESDTEDIISESQSETDDLSDSDSDYSNTISLDSDNKSETSSDIISDSEYESQIDIIINKLDYISENINQVDYRLIKLEYKYNQIFNRREVFKTIVFYMYFALYFFLQ